MRRTQSAKGKGTEKPNNGCGCAGALTEERLEVLHPPLRQLGLAERLAQAHAARDEENQQAFKAWKRASLLGQICLALLDLEHVLFDRLLDNEADRLHGHRLPESMASVCARGYQLGYGDGRSRREKRTDSLVLDRWVPERLHEVDSTSSGEVESARRSVSKLREERPRSD